MSGRSTKPISSTSFYVLLALADAERYGLEIIDEVAARTDGEILLGPGSLYNAIKRLLTDGAIAETKGTADADPRRRYYRITRRGRERLISEVRSCERVTRAARAKNLLGTSSR